ncbi:MAG: hypothetical protein LBK26_02080 [Rickettsiales bacterium]|nr:hypothetical protein [Rickettsiales bacterium]
MYNYSGTCMPCPDMGFSLGGNSKITDCWSRCSGCSDGFGGYNYGTACYYAN